MSPKKGSSNQGSSTIISVVPYITDRPVPVTALRTSQPVAG